MKLLYLIVILGTIHSNSACAQALWQNTHYGMSIAEVQAAQPSAKPITLDETRLKADVKLRLPNFQLVDQQFNVDFAFDSSGKLVLVLLRLENNYSASLRAAKSVKNALTVKYGSPSEDAPFDDLLTSIEWIEGHTEIHLMWSGSRKKDEGRLGIVYAAKSTKEDASKL